jgi:hypothetical protein
LHAPLCRRRGIIGPRDGVRGLHQVMFVPSVVAAERRLCSANAPRFGSVRAERTREPSLVSPSIDHGSVEGAIGDSPESASVIP